MGSAWTFLIACSLVIAWAACGPMFHYSENWQLVINTSTTIVTFLMVFLIQNTQNRDSKALHLKLDELIRAIKGARNVMVDLENCTEEELEALKKQFERVRRRAVVKEEQRDQRVNGNGNKPPRGENPPKAQAADDDTICDKAQDALAKSAPD